MIEPTAADIGRAVLYRPNDLVPFERGVITSFNNEMVFVRYGDSKYSAATRRRDLEWEFP